MHAADVLDIQGVLLDKLSTPSRYAELVATQGTYRRDGGRFPREAGEELLGEMTRMLRMADAYHVSQDMTELIVWAASQLDETDHPMRDMAPAEYGFVRFEKSLIMEDSFGKVLKAKLLLWGPERIQDKHGLRTVTRFHYFSDLSDPDDYADELVAEHGRDHLISQFDRYLYSGFEIADEVASLGPSMIEADDVLANAYASHPALGRPTGSHAYTNLLRQFYALWLLLQQTITRREDAHIPRPFARRAKRMGLPPRVSVIHLRHEANPGEGLGETNVRWSHRWLVRGTWQWRACGQDHPYAQPYEKGWRCRVWIRPHIKGPKHLPLVQSTKVYSLDR